MEHGLYHQLAEKRVCLASDLRLSRSATTEPRDAHCAGVNAGMLEREIEDLENQILADQRLCGEIQHAINFLTASKTKTRQRALALAELENAQSRLLRELGEKS